MVIQRRVHCTAFKQVPSPEGLFCVRNIDSVNRDVCKEYLLTHVIPAIKEKWPRKDRHKPIFIQQDNARAHVPSSDPDILAAGMADGWCIRLIHQPANSPDFNVLDFVLFTSIQAPQYRHPIYANRPRSLSRQSRLRSKK